MYRITDNNIQASALKRIIIFGYSVIVLSRPVLASAGISRGVLLQVARLMHRPQLLDKQVHSLDVSLLFLIQLLAAVARWAPGTVNGTLTRILCSRAARPSVHWSGGNGSQRCST
eukprot:scaffold128346_cov43-Prasinocladus_malaysianus.AAC.1